HKNNLISKTMKAVIFSILFLAYLSTQAQTRTEAEIKSYAVAIKKIQKELAFSDSVLNTKSPIKTLEKITKPDTFTKVFIFPSNYASLRIQSAQDFNTLGYKLVALEDNGSIVFVNHERKTLMYLIPTRGLIQLSNPNFATDQWELKMVKFSDVSNVAYFKYSK